MYQPDAIASFTVNGATYLITPTKGMRDWDAFAEEARVNSLPLDPAIFTGAVCGGGSCAANSRLGRLNVTTTLGRTDGTGLYEALYAFGARSFSIWTAWGTQVFDSGDDLEDRTSNLPGIPFNANNEPEDEQFDNRSDNKGPEPEAVAVGRLGRKFFAFLGLERVGGVMIYDVTSPTSPKFVTYINTRASDFGDQGPGGLTFVDAKRSPNQHPLLIVNHELSGTTAIYRINLH